jgi:proteasome accessory factor B
MSDAKTERLINLTLALLASKRYLTKNEIYNSVAGYDGTAETKERMFERDKDDLRSLGIEIEVGDLDPFFQDEPGYRIRPDEYALDLGELSPAEVAVLSVAADIWQESALSQNTHSALRKLQSLGIPADFSDIAAIDFRTASPTKHFAPILKAIEERRQIELTYQSIKQSAPLPRTLEPHLLTLWRGFWYLIAKDLSKGEIRTFKLTRIEGEITLATKKNTFTIDEKIDPRDYLGFETPHIESAMVLIRRDYALEIRKNGTFISSEGEWDRFSFAIDDQRTLLERLLPYADKIKVEAPESLKSEMIAALRELVHRG